MTKKSKVNSKKINHKNVLYVIGAVIVIVLLFTLVLKYTGKELAGKATEIFQQTDSSGKKVLPATITISEKDLADIVVGGVRTVEFEFNGKTYVLTVGKLPDGSLGGQAVNILDESNEPVIPNQGTVCNNNGVCDAGEDSTNCQADCPIEPTSEPKLPDLTIGDVTIGISDYTLNDYNIYPFNLQVINKGNVNSQPTVLSMEYWVDSSTHFMEESSIKGLNSNEIITIYTFVGEGISDGFTWVAEVDKSTDPAFVPITESDEQNNQLSGCLAGKSCYNLVTQKQGTCNAAGTLCEVTVIPTAPVCGNNQVEGTEECDDGDGNDNDGVLGGCRGDCTLIKCGDSILDTLAGETCDDGNLVTNDGCDSNCKIESTTGKNYNLRVDEVISNYVIDGISLNYIESICVNNEGLDVLTDSFTVKIISYDSLTEHADVNIVDEHTFVVQGLTFDSTLSCVDISSLFGSLEVDYTLLPKIPIRITLDTENVIAETNENDNREDVVLEK